MLNRILGGLQILAKYYSDTASVDFEHDQMWCGGNACGMALRMSTEDAKELLNLGWFIDEEYDVWSHF